MLQRKEGHPCKTVPWDILKKDRENDKKKDVNTKINRINPSSVPGDYSCPGIYSRIASGDYSSPSEEVTVYFH